MASDWVKIWYFVKANTHILHKRDSKHLLHQFWAELERQVVFSVIKLLVLDFLNSIMNNYSLIKRIGAGAFGSVHLAKSNKDGTQVVVKERFNFYVCFAE